MDSHNRQVDELDDMYIHEKTRTNEGWEIYKVHGGWIYSKIHHQSDYDNYETSVYVPDVGDAGSFNFIMLFVVAVCIGFGIMVGLNIGA